MNDADRLQMLLTTMTSLMQAAMLWWVSATALTVTIFAAVWRNIKRLKKHKRQLYAIFWMGAVFLASIIIAGVFFSWGTWHAFAGIHDICARLASNGVPYEESALSWIVPWSVAIGDTSFLIALFGWILIYANIQPKGMRARWPAFWRDHSSGSS